MTSNEAIKQISAANRELDSAIQALISFDSAPDYLEALESAAALLDGLAIDRITPADRAWLETETELLATRAAQAETLFQSAGALQFGGFLNHARVSSGYTSEGAVDFAPIGAFHIDG